LVDKERSALIIDVCTCAYVPILEINRAREKKLPHVKPVPQHCLIGQSGGTALHVATRRNHLDIVKLLLTHGADPNIQRKLKHQIVLQFLMKV
jgi:ankyrin repeat protein